MKRQYNPTPRRVRAVFAVAAALATTLVVASIDGLVLHYEPGLLLAKAAAVVVAVR